MSELDSLIRNVIQNPLDDSARLILADYLEEQDDPRAELIRLQLELAMLPDYTARYATLRKKERRLFRTYGPFGAAPSGSQVISCHGGFISGLKITIPRLRAMHDVVFSEAPITDLKLNGSVARLPLLGKCAGLRNVRRLELHVPKATVEKLLPFLLSENLTELRVLRVKSHFADLNDYVAEFVAKTYTAKLEDIEFYYSRGLQAPIQTFAAGDRIESLKVARLLPSDNHDNARVMTKEIQSLVTAPVYQSLEELCVFDANDEHLEQFAEAVWVRTLKRLALHRCRFRDFVLKLPVLRELNLTMRRRAPSLMRNILANCKSLEVLDLSSCLLNDDDARLLATHPLLSNLRRLDLENNGISLAGAEALGRSPLRKRGLRLRLVSSSLKSADRRKLQSEFGVTFGGF